MNQQSVISTSLSTTDVNKLLKNTYMLLAMTLAFSAVTAGFAMAINLGPMTSIGLSLGSLVLLFVTLKKADSSAGIFWVFAFTGMQGASLGYILNHYAGMANGPGLIMQALGLTSVIFVSLSAYALTTKKDFSFMRGFLFAGLLVMIGAMVINIFVGSSILFMAMNAGIALLMTGFILYDTSRIVNGGETNYVRATISLYLDFLNLFISLLHLMGIGSDD
jgi:modulator of FtsH protease